MSTIDRTQGVRHETVKSDQEGQRLDNWLSNRLKGLPRSLIYRMIRTGQVRIDGKRCKPSSRLQAGDSVRIPPARLSTRVEAVISERVIVQVRDRILFADDDLLVIDKPSGMAVHAGSGLPWGLIDVVRRLYRDEFVELVHRLDRDTSGCLVLARNGSALNHLSALFRESRVDKRYLCLLHGELPQPQVEVDAPLLRVEGSGKARIVVVSPEGKPAKTRFRLLKAWPAASYVEAELLSGRTHQIRVHAQHLGTPLAGDRRYSERESQRFWRKQGLSRLFLHAHSLEFEDQARRVRPFHAPLPDELGAVLDSLD
ncbi:MAG: RluA family pseudouridine synthase [Gammaproteobacteria bacterium]|nr:RluA family pseudouridine synthase [Gammaproteobacteria bacterium]